MTGVEVAWFVGDVGLIGVLGFFEGAFVAAEVIEGVCDLVMDVHAALVEGVSERGEDEPGVGGAGEVVGGGGEDGLEVEIGEGIELDGPEFEEEVAGVEVAEGLVVGEVLCGIEDARDDAGLPFRGDEVGACVEVVFAGVE